MARNNLQKAQERQKVHYRLRALEWELEVGNKVLIMLPEDGSKLLAQGQGPCKVSQ